MSEYGWLAESTVIPQKQSSKKINVDDSSLVALQVAMMQKKEELKASQNFSKAASRKSKQDELFMKKNKGVEERNKADLITNVSTREATHTLEKKTMVYEKLEKDGKNISKLLVDFSQKRFENMGEKDKADYQKERQAFYEEQKAELEKRDREIEAKKHSVSSLKMTQQFVQEEIERHEWEKQMLQELEDGITEDMKNAGEKNLVQQRYDRHATAEEKSQLEKVLVEENKDQLLLNEIKKKRNLVQEQRKNKLLSLNLQ